jgi:GMP synthase (glutamine-hydrolysing)
VTRLAPGSLPRVLVVEHEAGCPPALFGTWLEEASCALDVCRPWAGDELPEPTAYDALLVLGGEMGAYDDDLHPWLAPVKQAVRDAAEVGLPTLGICLGHQLAAVALGGTVARNPRGQAVGVLETGWTAAAADDPLMGGHVGRERGIQWNNDIVTVPPPGATVLATTPDGDLQVAMLAPTEWGVQLHPEADAEIVRAWAEGDRADHLERGIDTDAALAEIDAARDELDESWRPLAERFAVLAREHRARS